MPQKINIAFLISSMDVGGAEKSTLTLINELANSNYNVYLFLLVKQGGFLRKISKKCRVIDLNVKRTYRLPFKLHAALKLYNIKILVSNFWKLNLCSCITKIFTRDLALILYEHSPPSRTSTSPKLLYMAISSLLYPFASKIFAVSDYVKRDIQEITFGLNNKIVTMYNPVTPPKRAIEIDKRMVKSEGLNLLFVGRLEPDKNVEIILESLKYVDSSVHILRIVGDGSLRSELNDKVRTLGLEEKVTFYGQRSDVATFYELSDILILSSHIEGLPTVAIEALQYGIGIAATPIPGGLREILSGGKYGTISMENSPKSLANAIMSEAVREKSQKLQMEGASQFRPDVIAESFILEVNKLQLVRISE